MTTFSTEPPVTELTLQHCVCVERAPGRAGPAKSNRSAADTDIATEKHSPHNTKPPQHNAGTTPNCKDPTIPLHRNAPTLRDDHKTVTKIKNITRKQPGYKDSKKTKTKNKKGT